MSTQEAFREHVLSLLDKSLGGDEYALKSLACMALLVEGFPSEGDGESVPVNVVFMDLYRRAA